MNLIEGFTDQPKQTTSIILADGSTAAIRLEYKPNQTGWFYDLTWQDFALRGQRLTTQPNILKQWQNVLPFGLALVTINNVEPLNQDDLVNGTASFYLIQGDDFAALATALAPLN